MKVLVYKKKTNFDVKLYKALIMSIMTNKHHIHTVVGLATQLIAWFYLSIKIKTTVCIASVE